MKIKILTIGLFLTLALFAQDQGEEEEVLESLREQRQNILKFGIETEVAELLNTLLSDRDGSYNDDLLELIATEKSDDILLPVFQIFSETEYTKAKDSAMEELQKVVDGDSYNVKVVQAAMTYLANGEFQESADLFYEIIDKEHEDILSYALSQVGKLEPTDKTSDLLELFNEYEEEGNDVASNIIIAWGELRFEPALDILLDVVDDEYAEKNHRQLAAVALGKIGDPRGLEPVITLYEESGDSMVRSFALSGLQEFDDKKVDAILLQALTRDTFWRIRVAAAKGLGERGLTSAVDLLEYKLYNDPETQVQNAAAEALSLIGGSADRVLKDFLQDDKESQAVRITVLKFMLKEKSSGTVEAFETIMQEEWEKKDTQGKFLEYCCRETSLVEWSGLSEVYKKMLEHHNPYIQIYGIRGIKRNELTGLYDNVKALDADGVNGLVRREAADL